MQFVRRTALRWLKNAVESSGDIRQGERQLAKAVGPRDNDTTSSAAAATFFFCNSSSIFPQEPLAAASVT